MNELTLSAGSLHIQICFYIYCNHVLYIANKKVHGFEICLTLTKYCYFRDNVDVVVDR